MSYAVVEFINESSVEVVSKEWIEVFRGVRSDWLIRLYDLVLQHIMQLNLTAVV